MMRLTRNKATCKAEEKTTKTTRTTTKKCQNEILMTTGRFFGRIRRADDVGAVPFKLGLDLGDDEPSPNQLGKKEEEDRYMILMECGLFGSKHIKPLREPIPPNGKNATSKQQSKQQNCMDNNSVTTDEDSFLWSSVSTAAAS